VFLVAACPSPTNVSLLAAWRRLGIEAVMVAPEEAHVHARDGDVALARLDVLPTLDGVEAGLWELRRLGRRNVRLVNSPSALLTVHDKLATALRLGQVGLPHPRTAHIDVNGHAVPIGVPLVVKPRFGSWGRDVVLCASRGELERCLRRLRDRRWFRRQGALVQELIQPRGYDLRLLVVRGRVIGAVERLAPPGEWRTNVALGAVRRRVVPPPEACAAAVAAAEGVGADFVGVDLLPEPAGGWIVLELNGAVDFTAEYALDGRDVFEEAARLVAAKELGPLLLPSEKTKHG
jgi:RimK family alpha-L-glutamate ligase